MYSANSEQKIMAEPAAMAPPTPTKKSQAGGRRGVKEEAKDH